MLVTSSEEQSGIAPVEVDATGYVYQVFFLKVIGAGFTRLVVRFFALKCTITHTYIRQ